MSTAFPNRSEFPKMQLESYKVAEPSASGSPKAELKTARQLCDDAQRAAQRAINEQIWAVAQGLPPASPRCEQCGDRCADRLCPPCAAGELEGGPEHCPWCAAPSQKSNGGFSCGNLSHYIPKISWLCDPTVVGFWEYLKDGHATDVDFKELAAGPSPECPDCGSTWTALDGKARTCQACMLTYADYEKPYCAECKWEDGFCPCDTRGPEKTCPIGDGSECPCGGPAGHVPNGIHCMKGL
jgi:hypothetical protein